MALTAKNYVSTATDGYTGEATYDPQAWASGANREYSQFGKGFLTPTSGTGTSTLGNPSQLTMAQLNANPVLANDMDFSQVQPGQFGTSETISGAQEMGKMSDVEFANMPIEQKLELQKRSAFQQNADTQQLMGYGQLAASGLGAISSVASYFDNKDLREKQIEGLDQQIASSKYAMDRNKKFTSQTQSAFA